MKTGHVDRVAQLLDPPGKGEGIDVTPLHSGTLHAMVIDPAKTKVWVEHRTLPAVRNASSSGDSGNAWIWIASVGGLVLLLALLGLWRRRVRAARRD